MPRQRNSRSARLRAKPEGRTALLIRCDKEEADLIRNAAQQERRTVSGYVLNAVMQRIAARTRVRARLTEW